MMMPAEGAWPCEACGDTFLSNKALQAHYIGPSHQVKEDLKDLADAQAEGDLERARAHVAYDQKSEVTTTLKEKHEERRQGQMAEKLVQARAEAKEKAKAIKAAKHAEHMAAQKAEKDAKAAEEKPAEEVPAEAAPAE